MVKFTFCEEDIIWGDSKCFIAYHKKLRLHGMGKSMTKAARDLHKLIGRNCKFWLIIRPKHTGRIK